MGEWGSGIGIKKMFNFISPMSISPLIVFEPEYHREGIQSIIQEFSGHASSNTTGIYTHVASNKLGKIYNSLDR